MRTGSHGRRERARLRARCGTVRPVRIEAAARREVSRPLLVPGRAWSQRTDARGRLRGACPNRSSRSGCTCRASTIRANGSIDDARLGATNARGSSARSWSGAPSHERLASHIRQRHAAVEDGPLTDRGRSHAHPVPLRGGDDLAHAGAHCRPLPHHGADRQRAPEGHLRRGRTGSRGNCSELPNSSIRGYPAGRARPRTRRAHRSRACAGRLGRRGG